MPKTPCLQGISPDLAPSTTARQRVAFGTSFQFGRSVTSLDLDSKIDSATFGSERSRVRQLRSTGKTILPFDTEHGL
jgi:hypothetical protein